MCMSNEKRIIELREIYSCLSLSKNIGAKAFISFILSSGMNRNEALDLTIEDLVLACYDDKMDYLLERNPDYITPMWIRETEKTFKLNFSSPESLFYIFLHLKDRLSKTNLVESDKLFNISQSTLDDNLKISEHLTEIGSYNPFSFQGELVSHKFGAKALQEFFITQYLKHSPDYDNGKQRKYRGKSYSEYKVKLITLFTKGLPKDDEYYKKFSRNTVRLLIDYKKVLPYITPKNYDVIRPSWDEPSDWEIDFDARVDKLMKSKKRSFTNSDVSKIVSDYAHYKSINDENMLQVIAFAFEDNKIGYFEDSPVYLDNLFLKPFLKSDLESIIPDNMELNPLDPGPLVEEVISMLDENDIFVKYDIDENVFTYNLLSYMEDIEDKGDLLHITSDDLLEICFISQMDTK